MRILVKPLILLVRVSCPCVTWVLRYHHLTQGHDTRTSNISGFTNIRIDYAMIRRIRLIKTRETWVVFPLELTRVNDRTCHSGTMTTNVLSQRVNDNIGTQLEGAT